MRVCLRHDRRSNKANLDGAAYACLFLDLGRSPMGQREDVRFTCALDDQRAFRVVRDLGADVFHPALPISTQEIEP
jgi:hypothetical protein